MPVYVVRVAGPSYPADVAIADEVPPGYRQIPDRPGGIEFSYDLNAEAWVLDWSQIRPNPTILTELFLTAPPDGLGDVFAQIRDGAAVNKINQSLATVAINPGIADQIKFASLQYGIDLLPAELTPLGLWTEANKIRLRLALDRAGYAAPRLIVPE